MITKVSLSIVESRSRLKIFQFSFKIPIYRFNLINETIGGEMLIDEFDCEMKCPPPTKIILGVGSQNIYERSQKYFKPNQKPITI